MAINPIPNKPNETQLANASPGKKVKPDNTTPVNANNNEDKIDITAVAQKIKESFESSSSIDVIDQKKIAAVKAALQNGSYKINADSIAEKMLEIDRHFDST